jgi:hypothetical protein
MKYIAIGGLFYSIGKWLPGYTSFDVGAFNQRHLQNQIRELINSDSGNPYTLVGFSRGATMCVELVEQCPNVCRAYVHSCLKPRIQIKRKDIQIYFFRTNGDKAPGVYDQTLKTCESYFCLGAYTLCRALDPVSLVDADPKERFLLKMNHQFHNALKYIPDATETRF